MQTIPHQSCRAAQYQLVRGPALELRPCNSQRAGLHSGHSQCKQICQSLDPLMTLAATDPSALQDVIVGGAVSAAVGAALYSGLKKEPVPCDLCAGNGGIRCFACQGSMELIDRDLLDNSSSSSSSGQQQQRPPKRDIVGRTFGPKACRVCKGTGLVLCSKCKGSGYSSRF